MSPNCQYQSADCRRPARAVVKLFGSVLVACSALTACYLPSFTFKPSQKPVAESRHSIDAEFDSFRDEIYFDQSIAAQIQGQLEDAARQSQRAPDVATSNLIPQPPQDLGFVLRDSRNLEYCRRIDRKLKSVSLRNCLLKELHDSKFRSGMGNPIYYVHFEARAEQQPLGRVLVLGGVHGDELTSVSTVYLWINMLKQFHSGLFDWRLVPVVNPDGFFKRNPSRTNANGVDLNRNLPTYQWSRLANQYWKTRASGAERKYPGPIAASEPESKWLIDEIKRYKPDVIVTVHAPYNLVDYDASDRSSAPRRLGILTGKSLGTYPGSLGRYAGEERNIPVITLELPHSSRMPSLAATNEIWLDLVGWLRQHINTHNIAGRNFSHCNRLPGASGCI